MVTRRWALGLLPWLAFGLFGCSQGADEEGPKNLTERVHAAVKESLGTGLATTYSVAVWRDGAVIYAEAFGDKDADGTPASTRTLYQIGSDTKKLTAMALLQAVQAGKLELDQTVAEVLPDLTLAFDPTYLELVTVRDLLLQTTGLFDYAPFIEAPDDAELGGMARGTFAENEYSLMPPGIAWQYSNPNYALVGLITETLDGRPWADIVADDVVAPLGLQHTYTRRDDMLAQESDVASGHGLVAPFDVFDPLEATDDELGWVAPAEQFDCAFTRPAGLVWSTAFDQANLLGFFIDGAPDVLSDDLRHQMMSEGAPIANHGQGVTYGYGLFAQEYYASSIGAFYRTPFVGHDGGTLTMTSLSFILPEQRVAVSVLANGVGEDVSHVMRVAVEAAAEGRLPEREPSPPKPFGEPSSDLASYVGSYTDPNLGEATITEEGDHLVLSIPAIEALGAEFGPLEPVGNDLFMFEVDGERIEISFYDAEDGTPHAYGVNRQFVLTRQPEP